MNGSETGILMKELKNGSVEVIKKPGFSTDPRMKYHLEFSDRKNYISGWQGVWSFAQYPLFDSLDYWKRYKVKDLIEGEQVAMEI